MQTEEEKQEKIKKKILIIQPSSYELKIGLSNSEPISIPHCLIDFVNCEKEENFYYEESINEEEKKNINEIKNETLKNIKEISQKNRKTIKEKFVIRKTIKEENETMEEQEEENKKKIELIGKKAIEYSMKKQKGNLFYPIKSGYFNTSKNRSLLYVSDCLEKIWKSEIEKLIPTNEYKVINFLLNLIFYKGNICFLYFT